ncbi:hypothetical protein FOA43_000834 [Brettanomyces nanus]|uniref:Autophagy-related protein 18 n=1 Tax=Eeniella nana TaxID=13502 RepID=A0A875RY59_EENNA|nr:uncharacterized protein FOA43_000834 [Brettanomyces nanus]QPG73523.1 hypothetical protein FOA43_000834 [Brettanomyces nanus]
MAAELLGNSSTQNSPSSAVAASTKLSFANFNQNFSCISVGYNDGYRVYNCEPFGQCYEYRDGSFEIVEMLFTSSLLALVGTGEQDALSPRRLRVINTKRQTTICELTFPNTILAVKMNRERLIVLLETTIYIYDINNMRLLHTVEIPANSSGLVALSASTDHNYLAYPSPPRVAAIGDVKQGVKNSSGGGVGDGGISISSGNTGGIISAGNGILDVGGSGSSIVEATAGATGSGGRGNKDGVHGRNGAATSQLRRGDVVVFNCETLQPISVIEGHKTKLAAIALSRDGTLLATASDKGTIIRVFSVERGIKLYQFRRGTYPTKIYSLAFSEDNRFVVASSATETVHIFRLGEEELINTQRRRSRRRGSAGGSAEAFTHLTGTASTRYTESTGSAGSVSAESDGSSDDSENVLDDDDCIEAYDVLEPLPDSLERKKSTSSGTSSGSSNSLKMEPVVDSSRRSVARMLRRTSQSLGRKAAEKMGGYLPPRFSSILEPNRHFASLKVPASKDTSTIVGIGGMTANYLREDDTNSADAGADLAHKNALLIMVVTSEGFFYTFELDPDRGGDCVLLNQRSLLE